MDLSPFPFADQLAERTRAVAALISPAVVSIGTDSRGSGVVIAPGKVLTNAHHLRDRTTSVRFADGRVEQGRIAGSDVDGDLVVLDVDTADVEPLAVADAAAAAGDAVFAASRDHDSLSVTFGQVAAVARTFTGPRGRPVRGGVEHSAPLRRGSSGGPLLDVSGRLLGIDTHRLPGGFYVARPVDEQLRAVIDRLSAGESVRRPRLGVAVASADITRRLRRSVGLPDLDGLLVRHVDEGSPAAAAGIEQGDVLVRAGDVALTTPEVLFDVLAAAGEVVVLHVVRGVDERTVEVLLTPTTEA